MKPLLKLVPLALGVSLFAALLLAGCGNSGTSSGPQQLHDASAQDYFKLQPFAELPAADPSEGPAWPSVAATSSASNPWENAAWLDRASRALRDGAGLSGASESPAVLLAQGREAVVSRFVSDPRFADTMLAFNMSFLGFRVDGVRLNDGTYNDLIYELPHAIAAARSLLQPDGKGDYLSLFDLKLPIYLGPLRRPRNLDKEDATLDAPALRQKIYGLMRTDLDAMIELEQPQPPAAVDSAKVCNLLNRHLLRFVFSNPLNLPDSIPNKLMFLQPDWYLNAFISCTGQPQPQGAAPFDMLAALKSIRAQNEGLFAALAEFEPAVYAVTDLSSLKKLDVSGFSPKYIHTPFTTTVQVALQNSSTNFDRKRAAYYLKRFFCDDLTPVNVQLPAVHAGSAHASDPSCVACHYKLDPMAGFFRNLGISFFDFTGSKTITFDDQATADLAEYSKAWQPGPDAQHPWNVGYVRSSVDPSRNSYGSDLTDLYRILKTAPEVRRCMMRRMYGYFLSDAQTIDGGYLDSLTQSFSDDLAAEGSAAAIRGAASRIVLSQGFSRSNRDSNACYDFAPGKNRAASLPCAVASIVGKSCVQCHSSTSSPPYLDLSSWAKQPDGMMGFNHLAKDGATPVPAAETFQEILSRISSTDSASRMPFMSDMPATDRAALYTWIETQHGGGAAP